MATLRFWTPKEESNLLKVVKDAVSNSKGIRTFAEQSGRTVNGVSFKFYSLTGNLDVPKRKKLDTAIKLKNKTSIEKKLNTSTNKGIDLPSGFVFNFTPKKAEMHENHVRLYF